MEDYIIDTIEEIVEQPIEVYIKINANNEIIEVGSSIFIKDLTSWIKIDEGYGDRYSHAQSQYFDKSLANEDGTYNYKYEYGRVIGG